MIELPTIAVVGIAILVAIGLATAWAIGRQSSDAKTGEVMTVKVDKGKDDRWGVALCDADGKKLLMKLAPRFKQKGRADEFADCIRNARIK